MRVSVSLSSWGCCGCCAWGADLGWSWASANVAAMPRKTTNRNVRMAWSLTLSGSTVQGPCPKSGSDPDFRDSCTHPVSAALLRAIKRLVGRADHLRRGLQPAGGRARADRDGDREMLE